MTYAKITAKCVGCQKTWEVTPAMQIVAKLEGAAMSPCCMMPGIVIKSERKESKNGKCTPQA